MHFLPKFAKSVGDNVIINLNYKFMDKVIIVVCNKYQLFLDEPYSFDLPKVVRLRNVVRNLMAHKHTHIAKNRELLLEQNLPKGRRARIEASLKLDEKHHETLASIFPALEQDIERRKFSGK